MRRIAPLLPSCMAVVLAAYHARAATSSALSVPSCTNSNLSWTFNTHGQSPCEVAASLEGDCPGQWIMAPLSPGGSYGGPLQGHSDPCQCSTVAFSLVAACAACQGGQFIPWSSWRFNCSESDITVARFPFVVPPGTNVPAWAYLDVTKGNVWDMTAAHALAEKGHSEVTGGSPSPTKQLADAHPTSSIAASASPAAAHASTGPIAGGVIGGFVIICVFALLGIILYRRRYRPDQRVRSVNEVVDIIGTHPTAPERGNTSFDHHGRMTPQRDHHHPTMLYDPPNSSAPLYSPYLNYSSHNVPYSPHVSMTSLGRASDVVPRASSYSRLPEV